MSAHTPGAQSVRSGSFKEEELRDFETVEDEMRKLEADPSVDKHALRLFMQSAMPCGHAAGNLLTCPDPPFGCVICLTSLSPRVYAYIAEEVRRQGHDLAIHDDGGVRVEGMAQAWRHAKVQSDHAPTVEDVLTIAASIEKRNKKGFRKVAVMIARQIKTPVRLRERVQALLGAWTTLQPLEIYREFEEIHPFEDGNGRTGKVLLNWRNGSLAMPIFPPRDFWGREIQNP